MNPITIRPDNGRLLVLFSYTPERVAKIKSVPGRLWHALEKRWSVPHDPSSEARLRTLFAGEVSEATPAHVAAPPPDALFLKIRTTIRARHFSPRTEETYVGWIRRFLSSLATDAHVSASTQNQALHSILFLYEQVLGKKIERLEEVVRAKRSIRVPVVLSRQEVLSVLNRMSGTPRLMATLLYGSGLRVLECCNLRVKDIDFALNQIVVRAGKGNKDRYTTFPASAIQPIQRHLEEVRRQHQ